MKSYFVETSAIVAYLRGQADVVERLGGIEGELTSSFVCLSELYEGINFAKTKTDQEKAEAGVRQFFSGLDEVFGLDWETAQEFGAIRKSLRQEGKLIEDLDILIAATCLAHNLKLITLNVKHFRRVRNLNLHLLE